MREVRHGFFARYDSGRRETAGTANDLWAVCDEAVTFFSGGSGTIARDTSMSLTKTAS